MNTTHEYSTPARAMLARAFDEIAATAATAKTENAMKIANLVWDGTPADPLEHAAPCPHCGEIPEWERDGKFSTRYRLNCCGVNSDTRGYYAGHESDAVIAWNQAVAYELEAIDWAKEDAEREARRADEDAWVDANLEEITSNPEIQAETGRSAPLSPIHRG